MEFLKLVLKLVFIYLATLALQNIISRLENAIENLDLYFENAWEWMRNLF